MKTYHSCPRCNGTGRYDQGTCFRCHGQALELAKQVGGTVFTITGTEIATGVKNVAGIMVQAGSNLVALRAAKTAMRCAKVPRFIEDTMRAVAP